METSPTEPMPDWATGEAASLMKRRGYSVTLDDLRILADAVCALDAATLPDDKRLVTGCHAIIRRALGADFQLIYCEEDAPAAPWIGVDMAAGEVQP